MCDFICVCVVESLVLFLRDCVCLLFLFAFLWFSGCFVFVIVFVCLFVCLCDP